MWRHSLRYVRVVPYTQTPATPHVAYVSEHEKIWLAIEVVTPEIILEVEGDIHHILPTIKQKGNERIGCGMRETFRVDLP
jgi:hypothetical protein